jgi:hypothetical protein
VSEASHRIISSESAILDQTAADLKESLGDATELLSGICILLNCRQRYYGQTGEHSSVLQFDGINTIDALDEHLLQCILSLLDTWIQDARPEVDADAREILVEACGYLKKLPKHPVAYMVIFSIRQMFETLESILDAAAPERATIMEIAFVDLMHTTVAAYVQTRITPVERHFSDIAREYAVVARLACECGEGPYRMKQQALVETEDGGRADQLDLVCVNCQAETTLTFPLPHFNDLNEHMGDA